LDCRARGARGRACDRAGAGDRRAQDEDSRQLRGAHARERHSPDRRDRAENRTAIEAATFIGSSPIRRFTEGWSDDFLLQTTEKAVKYAVSLGLDVMYVTEDTSRCDPETVKRLYATAITAAREPS
jgi:isopropylmalate/homocitrate/citramalate synthase